MRTRRRRRGRPAQRPSRHQHSRSPIKRRYLYSDGQNSTGRGEASGGIATGEAYPTQPQLTTMKSFRRLKDLRLAAASSGSISSLLDPRWRSDCRTIIESAPGPGSGVNASIASGDDLVAFTAGRRTGDRLGDRPGDSGRAGSVGFGLETDPWGLRGGVLDLAATAAKGSRG